MPATKYNSLLIFQSLLSNIHRERKTHIHLWLSLRRQDQSTNKTSRDISSFLKIAGKQIREPLVAILTVPALCQMQNILGSTHSVSPVVYSSLWLTMCNVLGRHWYDKKRCGFWIQISVGLTEIKTFSCMQGITHFRIKTLLFLTEPCKQQDCYVHSDKWYRCSSFCRVGINKATSYTIRWME